MSRQRASRKLCLPWLGFEPFIIEINITGTLPPTGNLKPNLKASPSRFTHAKSAQSVNH